MSDSQSDIIYTQDDELRYEEIVRQVHMLKANTKRKSMLAAAEIFRVLQIKKHEYDCLGNSLINFLYSAEVVRIMMRLNVSYVEDNVRTFRFNLKKELAYANRKKDKFIATLKRRKAILFKMDTRDLRAEVLEDIKSSEELIKTRYSSFLTYLKMLREQHRDIAAVVEVTDELKFIQSRIFTIMQTLSEKRKMVSLINFDVMVDYISADIDHAIDILNCQANSLSDNVLANIEELNNLINLYTRREPEVQHNKMQVVEDVEVVEDPEQTRTRSEEVIDNESTELEKMEVSKVVKGKEDKDLADLIGSEYSSDDDDAGEGDLGYLKANVQKPLVKALVQCTLQKPVDRICFVSRFIRNYRENVEKSERKNEELRFLLAERERIQLRKQARQEEEELRKRLDDALRVTMQPEGEE